MANYELERDGKVLLIRLTRAGRANLGVDRFVRVVPWVAGGLGLLFGIDWLGRELVGEGLASAPIPVSIYVSVVVGVSFLIGLGTAIGRGIRTEVWAIDPGEKVVVFETSVPWGGVVSSGVDFAEIQKIHYDRDAGEVSLVLGGAKETICRGDVAQIALAIKELLNDTDVDYSES